MTPEQPKQPKAEEKAWAYLVERHKWVANDPYFQANPDKCETRNAWLAGYAEGEAEREELKHALESRLKIAINALEYLAGESYDLRHEAIRLVHQSLAKLRSYYEVSALSPEAPEAKEK